LSGCCGEGETRGQGDWVTGEKKAKPKRSFKSRVKRFFGTVVFLAIVGACLWAWAYHYVVYVPAGIVGEGSQAAVLLVRKSVPSFGGTYIDLGDVNIRVAEMEPRVFNEGGAVPKDLFPFMFEKLSKAEPGTAPPADYEQKIAAAIRKTCEAEGTYYDEAGMYGTMGELIAPDDGIPLVPPDYGAVVYGYRLNIEVSEDGESYVLTAEPAIANSELLYFCATQDGDTRFETGKPATSASPPYAAEPDSPDAGD